MHITHKPASALIRSDRDHRYVDDVTYLMRLCFGLGVFCCLGLVSALAMVALAERLGVSLPEASRSGLIDGVCARGAITIAICWAAAAAAWIIRRRMDRP